LRLADLEHENDIELAQRLIAGDRAAFEQFVERFRARIFQYAWLMCGSREDAEEVAQEALLRVFQNFDQLREPEHLRSWVFRIARNECLTKRRKSVFAPEHELSLDDFMPAKSHENGEIKIEIADWSGLPEDQVLQSELKILLRRAITELPEGYRSVLLLRDMEELSTQETAHILDLSEDVVKTRLHRARLALRKSFDEYLRARTPVLEGKH
jgi:RNA polymerase sigma-70 factor (ECF subfamily)